MNKNDLIASVSSSAGLSKSDATRSIESLLDTITNALKRGEKVSIVGFGNLLLMKEKQLQVGIQELESLYKSQLQKDQNLLWEKL